jgi:hypothetical protein
MPVVKSAVAVARLKNRAKVLLAFFLKGKVLRPVWSGACSEECFGI